MRYLLCSGLLRHGLLGLLSGGPLLGRLLFSRYGLLRSSLLHLGDFGSEFVRRFDHHQLAGLHTSLQSRAKQMLGKLDGRIVGDNVGFNGLGG